VSSAVAVYGGTFDPVTLGHVEVARRAAAIFARLIVCVSSSGRATHFDVDERVRLWRPHADAVGASVEPFDGLLVEHAMRRGARVLVRGVRSPRDLEVETTMAFANAALAPTLETVFLPPTAATALVSSSLVREIASLGGDVGAWVPPNVADALRRRPPSRPRAGS
jgi:pantetheine-phosphate adenylyltransferase